MAKKSGRLASLDIFRGMTVAFMIIVNNPGSWDYVYAPLRHSKWDGCTPTDLVYPFFLFIVGFASVYSLKKYGNELNWSSFLRISRRMAAIFLLGLFLGVFPYFGRDYSHLRIMGVLQRIAIAYGLGAIICLAVRREYLWIVVVSLLLLYWAILALFGGADPYSLEGNIVLKTDLAILGKNHLYTGFGIPFEPEGLLSTLPSVCTVLIGYYTGGIVSSGKADGKTMLKVLLLGAASFGLGYLWNRFFPINKPLWTSSYVLYSAGLAMAVFAVLYLIADVFNLQKAGTFFMVFGTNAIYAYFVSGILARLLSIIQVHSGSGSISLTGWFYQKVCAPVAGNFGGSLLFAVLEMLFIWALTLILYRRKIIIRL